MCFGFLFHGKDKEGYLKVNLILSENNSAIFIIHDINIDTLNLIDVYFLYTLENSFSALFNNFISI